MNVSAPSANTPQRVQRRPSGRDLRDRASDGVAHRPTGVPVPILSGSQAGQLSQRAIEEITRSLESVTGITDRPDDYDNSEPEGSAQPADDDNDDESDSDSSSTDSSDEDHVIPHAIREAERAAGRQVHNQPQSLQVDRRYRGFLRTLCLHTATENADQHIRDGLEYAISTARSLRLDRDFRDDEPLDMYAFALVIHVWQLVCLRLQHGRYPSNEISLSSQWGSYFLSSYVLVKEQRCKVSVTELKFAVEYWEERLKQVGGGTQWMEDQWAKDIDQINQDLTFHRNDTADLYLKKLEDGGMTFLTKCIIEEEAKVVGGEKTQLRVMAQESEESLGEARCRMAIMLHSMNRSLLKAIIQGQVPRLVAMESGEVYDALWKLNEGDEYQQPSIYMNSICDWAGMSPTVAQWFKICDLMLLYIQDKDGSKDLAVDVDQIIHPKSKWPRELASRGLRRYMDWRSYTQNGRSQPDIPRRKMVRYFVDQLQHRIKNEPLHAPLSVPVVEIGFSANPERRLRQHHHHDSSNYLMNLAEAMFRYHYRGNFRLLQRIIYTCFKPIQTWMGEIVFTQLAQGYVEGGGGFSHEPAGRSNASSFHGLTEEGWQSLAVNAYASGELNKAIHDEYYFLEDKVKAATKAKEDPAKQRKAEEDYRRALGEFLDAELEFYETEIRRLRANRQ